MKKPPGGVAGVLQPVNEEIMANPISKNNVIEFRPREAQVMSDQPHLDDGYVRVVNALAEALASFRLTQHQHQVVWAIIRKTYGWGKSKDRISGAQLAELTGLTREECSRTLAKLIEMRVVIRDGGAQSDIKLNTRTSEWVQPEKRTKSNVCRSSAHNKNSTVCSNSAHIKNSTVCSNSAHIKNGTVCSNSAQNLCSNSAHTKDNKENIYNPTDVGFVETAVSAQPAAKTKKSKIPPCPVQQIVDLYHEILPELPAVVSLNDKRTSQIKARWKQTVMVPGPNGTRELRECWNLDFWVRYFKFIRRCKFLMGQVEPGKGRERPFVANLEWITNSTNFVNILEGRYAN